MTSISKRFQDYNPATPITAEFLNELDDLLSGIGGGNGASGIGYQLAGLGTVLRNLQAKGQEFVTLQDFGAVGNDLDKDTLALQRSMVFFALPDTPKKLRITNCVTGVYKIGAMGTIAAGGLTLEWENCNVRLKKYFNGEVFAVRAGKVKFVNPGIDGNAVGGFTGGGIRFGPATQFTYDCVIEDPNIFDTQDSPILFEGPRGGAGIRVRCGTLLASNPGGASSGGYPSARVVGPGDTEPSDRQFLGVKSSSQPLVDLTGMANTHITDCFAGTILFKGNPDVTGVDTIYGSCSEVYISNTYIRDGMTISGLEIMVNTCLTHGAAPLYDGVEYGGAPSSHATYGWRMTEDTIACRMGADNVVSLGIVDDSPNGHAIVNQCSLFSYGIPMVTDWTGAATDPVIGNGFVLSLHDTDYKTIDFRVKMVSGSTTTFGSGKWSFALPKWASLLAPPLGEFVLQRPGLGATEWISGKVVLTSTGSVHRVSLLANDGTFVGGELVGGFPVGTTLNIDFSYPKG